MPLNQEFYSLKNVRFTMKSGLVADANEVSFARKLETADRTSGMSLTEQTVLVKEQKPDIKVKGWNSSDLHFHDIIPGDSVETMTLLSTESGTPPILQTDFFTKWPVDGMCFGDTSTTLGEKPSEWETNILCGVLNPGILGAV